MRYILLGDLQDQGSSPYLKLPYHSATITLFSIPLSVPANLSQEESQKHCARFLRLRTLRLGREANLNGHMPRLRGWPGRGSRIKFGGLVSRA